MTDIMISDIPPPRSPFYPIEEDDGRDIFPSDRKVDFAKHRMTTLRANRVFGGAIEIKRAFRQNRHLHRPERGAKSAVSSIDNSNTTAEASPEATLRQTPDVGGWTLSTSLSLTLSMANGFAAGYRIIYTATDASAIRPARYPKAYTWLGYSILALIAAGLIASLVKPSAVSDLGVPAGFTLWAVAAYLIRRTDKNRLDA